jgi:hypothetical protein
LGGGVVGCGMEGDGVEAFATEFVVGFAAAPVEDGLVSPS